MKLLGSNASPYTRKVRVVAAEKKVDLEYLIANPWEDPVVAQHNPLGKVPVLVLDDGSAIYDSRVIVEYLDNISPVAKLIPAANRERIEVRRLEALADGLLDAGIAMRLEGLREQNLRSATWVARQRVKVDSSLELLEKHASSQTAWCMGTSFSLADIAIGSALGWLEFRFPEIGWRNSSPGLVRIMQRLNERPSFADTAPRA